MPDPDPRSGDADNTSGGEAAGQDKTERDFGDSAGYGTGGSTLDRRDVGDSAPDETQKPNPLDEVVKTGGDGNTS